MAGFDRALGILRRHTGIVLTLSTVLLSPAAVPAVPGDAAPAADIEELDEVVVTGRIPGPPLWKVSRDDHVLWILPLVDAYPRNIEWDSARVEALIGHAQEYIERPLASWGISTPNPFTMARLLSVGKRYSRLDKGEKLSDLLPSDLYRRYEALKARHFPRDSSMESRRVSVAGMELQRAIMDREDLAALNYRHRGVCPMGTNLLREGAGVFRRGLPAREAAG